MIKHILSLLITLAIVSGCHCYALTIGPTVEREVIIVEPGNPVRVMEKKTIEVRVQPIGDKTSIAKAKINLGGSLIIMRWDWVIYEARLKALRKIELENPELVKAALKAVKEPATGQTSGSEFADPSFALSREGRGDGAGTRKIYGER